MEAPKCKICEQRHWGTCSDHSARGSLSDRQPLIVAKRAVVEIEGAAVQQPTVGKRGRPPTGIDRKEQKRIAAAKRRAKQR